jgi:hypothetical protein
MARLAVFIDGAYLDSIARFNFGGASIDLEKFASEVQATVTADTPEPVDLLRTFYYNCPPYQSAAARSPNNAGSKWGTSGEEWLARRLAAVVTRVDHEQMLSPRRVHPAHLLNPRRACKSTVFTQARAFDGQRR